MSSPPVLILAQKERLSNLHDNSKTASSRGVVEQVSSYPSIGHQVSTALAVCCCCLRIKKPRRAFLFCVLVAYFNKKPTMVYFFLFEQKLYYFQYIYCSVRKHALRKTRYLPNHICYASAVYLTTKLTFTAIFLVLLSDQFDAFSNPKNTSETNTSNTPPT